MIYLLPRLTEICETLHALQYTSLEPVTDMSFGCNGMRSWDHDRSWFPCTNKRGISLHYFPKPTWVIWACFKLWYDMIWHDHPGIQNIETTVPGTAARLAMPGPGHNECRRTATAKSKAWLRVIDGIFFQQMQHPPGDHRTIVGR